MNKLILSKTQAQEFVLENKYPVAKEIRLLSRCIDCRYVNDENLPALAFPGADVGELALLFATANDFGLEMDIKKAIATFIEVIGGVKNLS
ncbi:MAG: hypothetical protein Q7R95_09550 [bacterium]|nr:hypothetical protein [bacterium]